MDKFGEVDEDGNVKITSSNFSLIQDSNTYINFSGGSISIQGGTWLRGYTYANNLYLDYSPIEGGQAVNKFYVDENKEDFNNKKDIITKDIAESEPDAYPTVGAVYNFVNEQIGDIEAAAANIIALQNSYINGGNA